MNTRTLLAVALLLVGSGCAASTPAPAQAPQPRPDSVELDFLDLPPEATQYLFTPARGPA